MGGRLQRESVAGMDWNTHPATIPKQEVEGWGEQDQEANNEYLRCDPIRKMPNFIMIFPRA
jgi:hypothetical protein